MRFTLCCSLKKGALATIAFALWKPYLIIFPLDCNDKNKSSAQFRKIKQKVRTNVQNLILPEKLKWDLLRFVDAVGFEMAQWVYLLRLNCSDEKSIRMTLPKISWTMHGTIDQKRSVDTLVQEETISTEERYKLAYMYCLEERIPYLWGRLDADMQCNYPEKLDEAACLFIFPGDERVSCELNECFNSERNPDSHRHRHLVLNLADPTVEHFIERLQEERNNRVQPFTAAAIATLWKVVLTKDQLLIARLLRGTDIQDFGGVSARIMCFLLNGMDEVKQMQVFKIHSAAVLTLLLNWPWQEYFLKLCDSIFSFLSKSEFHGLLKQIVTRMKECKDYDYAQIFTAFWERSSIVYKMFSIGASTNFHAKNDSIPYQLILLQDWKNFNLYLKFAGSENRRKILFYPKIIHAYQYLMFNCSENSLECFVAECLLSEEEICEFSTIIRARNSCVPFRSKSMTLKRDRVFAFFDDLINKKCTFEAEKNSK